MFNRMRKSNADLHSAFLASTCALIIGLDLCWTPNPEKFEAQHAVTVNITKNDGENVKAVMYLVAISWSMWAGTLVYYRGPYIMIAFGVTVSIMWSVVLSIIPMSIRWLYLVRVLQGLGCGSLTVAIPLYIVNSTKGLYQSAFLCLIEVFILIGMLVSHASNVYMTWDRMNILTISVTLVNVLSLVLMRRKPSETDSSDPTADLELYPCLSDSIITLDLPEPYVKTGLFADKVRRNHIFVCVVLFAFRDFSGVRVFKKSIQRIYNELHACGPMPYRKCAMYVTYIQVMFAIVTVFTVEVYGRRKLLLISTFGMILSMVSLEAIIWNHGSNTVIPDRYTYLAIVLVLYIIFFAQGLGSIPWVVQLDKFHKKVRCFTTGLIISVHFLFLMITEFSYINEKYIYGENTTAAYWFIIVCILQAIFVNYFVLEKNMFDESYFS